MKTYLIPSDFSLESLKALDLLATKPGISGAKIVFLHAFKIADSTSDMLFLSRRNRDLQHIGNQFLETLDAYKAKYPGLFSAFAIEYFYGSTTITFKNFLKAQNIDLIIKATDMPFKPINKYSINPQILIERAGCPVLNLDGVKDTEVHTISKKLEPSTIQV